MVVATLVSPIFWLMLALSPSANGLTHGRDAKEGEFPYIVRILVSEKIRTIIDVKPNSSRENPDALAEEQRCARKEVGRGVHLGGHSQKSEGSQSTGCTKAKQMNRPIITRLLTEKDWGRIKKELLIEFSSNKAAKVAAGTLITTKRILTACKTLASFTGSAIAFEDNFRMLVMAGSINVSNKSGEFEFPSGIFIHPYCKFMISTKTILFNYGIITMEKPFGLQSEPGWIAPITSSFKTGNEMETTLMNMITGYDTTECHTIGWGNDGKRFEGRGMPDAFRRFAQVLQTTPMKVVDFPECYEAACKYFKQCLKPILEYGYFCAKAAMGGPCTEDWASPLICGGQVFGIHVEPARCQDRGIPRLFLRVDLGFDFVFDIKSRSVTSAVGDGTVIAALLAFSWHLQG